MKQGHCNQIAAVILNYRRADLTTRCVASLSGQVSLALVVDNSGHEEETKRLAECMAVLAAHGEKTDVEVVDPGENLGFGRGVDYGISRLTDQGCFECILLINNDAVASEGMVEGMLETLREQKGNALVSAKMRNSPSASFLWYHRLFALVLRRPCLGAFPYLSGACLLVPWSLAKDGLFDPAFFMYGEDVELSWRMTQTGVPLVVADVICNHTGSASARMGSLFYEYHLARGHLMLARKLARNQLIWWVFLCGRAISLPLRATLRCLRQKSLIPWRGLLLALIGKTPLKPDSEQ